MSTTRDIRLEVRAYLFKQFKQGASAVDATQNAHLFLGKNVPSYSRTKYWFKRFRKGESDLNDRSRSGRTKKVINENLKALMEADPKQNIRKLAEKLGISYQTLLRHLRELGMYSRPIRRTRVKKFRNPPLLVPNETVPKESGPSECPSSETVSMEIPSTSQSDYEPNNASSFLNKERSSSPVLDELPYYWYSFEDHLYYRRPIR